MNQRNGYPVASREEKDRVMKRYLERKPERDALRGKTKSKRKRTKKP